MVKGNKIVTFFLVLFLTMFLIVGTGVVIAGRDRISFGELFSYIHPVYHEEISSLSNDLVSAGVNLETQYNLGQIKFVCSSMSAGYGGDWIKINNQVQNAQSINELTQGISSTFGGVKCTYHVEKFGWDSTGPNVCSQTCGTKKECYSCCDLGKADPGEEWDEDDYNRCYKACDKIKVSARDNTNQDSDLGN